MGGGRGGLIAAAAARPMRQGKHMVLGNKLGISSDAELAREEERLTKVRALELFERGLLDWIRHQFATSSGWRVRPGEHGHHFEMLGILGQ